MKRYSYLTRALSLLLLVLLLLCPVLALSSCLGTEENEITEEQYDTLIEDLTAAVDAGCTTKYSYVSSYLIHWGFPGFNTVKMKSVERCYNNNFIDDLGYSSSESLLALATTVARCYIENILTGAEGKIAFTLAELQDNTLQTDALIAAYAASVGDRYSRYYDVAGFNSFMEDLSGSFAGIGVYVLLDREAGTVTVSDVIEGSSAESAGILPGDMIVKVDDKSINDYDVDTFMDFVKGEVGTSVTVTVLRDGAEISYSMTRVPIEAPSVHYEMLDDGIVYMAISAFNDNTDEQFLAMMDEIERAGEVKGYIFDLRYNGGGYCDVAINMLSHFVPKGTKIVAEGTKYGKYWSESNSDHVITEPIVILCNEYSASAAELFTAAIRDFRDGGLLNARIVGVTTFGKGKLQNIYSLGDGTAVVFTTGLFNPPCDVNFDGVGVTPDVTVELIPDGATDNQFEAALAELMKMINNK